MEGNSRPMFIIKNAKDIALHRNTTTADVLADVEGNGETKIEATENIAGLGNQKPLKKTDNKTSIWQKISTAMADNLIKVIIGVIAALLLSFLKYYF